MKRAVTSSAMAIPRWILRFSQPHTMPAPNQAPTTAAAISSARVSLSTAMTVI